MYTISFHYIFHLSNTGLTLRMWEAVVAGEKWVLKEGRQEIDHCHLMAQGPNCYPATMRRMGDLTLQ